MKGNFVLCPPAGGVDEISALSARLKEDIRYRSMWESNWVASANGYIAGFEKKNFYLLDNSWTPYLTWESDSFIAACGISDSVNYAVCVTAYNRDPDCSAENGVFVLFDVARCDAVATAQNIGIDPNGIRQIFIDDQKCEVWFYVSGKYMDPDQVAKVRCGFDLVPDANMLKDYQRLNQRKKK